jgi:hypothetical protein
MKIMIQEYSNFQSRAILNQTKLVMSIKHKFSRESPPCVIRMDFQKKDLREKT